MTATLRLEKELAYIGDVVLLSLRVRRAGYPPITIRATLDTGAGISVFNGFIAESLGIDNFAEGRRISLGVADGTVTEGYV